MSINITNAKLRGQPTITDLTNAQHNHSNAAGGGTVSGGGDVTTAQFNRLQDNMMLLAFRQQMIDSVIKQSMVYGFADEFEDESFVATGSCVNQLYDSTNDLYSPSGGFDSYQKALLHMDGSNAGTTFTDESGKTWTPRGNAQTSTTSPKFGTAAAAFDGTGDSIDTPAHADFNVGAGDFTIDFWVKMTATGAQEHYCGQMDSSATASTRTNLVYKNASNYIVWEHYGGGSLRTFTSAATFTGTSAWHHIAVVRYGNTGKLYVDGVADSNTVDLTGITLSDGASKMGVGVAGDYVSNSYLNGKMDEFRFSKGIARWTANFTPQTAAYASVKDNMTLVSNAATALSAPTSARLILFEEDVDATTINTDIKGYVSRDNGTTYSEVTLVDQGDYATSKQLWAGTVDISGQPSGTSVKAKIVSANNKDFKLHGWGVNWS